jgi:hypothetical protein
MTEYKHHVSGFFVKREEAQIALFKLIDRGLAPDQLRIYDDETAARHPDACQANCFVNLVVASAPGPSGQVGNFKHRRIQPSNEERSCLKV